MRQNYLIPYIATLSAALGFSAQLQAAVPFASCPTEAFLIQNPSSIPVAYGISLDVGSYSTLSWQVGNGKINAIGYNAHDDYIYGWDYSAQTLTKIGSDFTSNPLSISNLNIGPSSFYVGDVSTVENAWYGYRFNQGLFKIDLDTLVMTKVASAATVGNLRILDMAFHPDEGVIYSVDNNGYLYKIDPNTGISTKLNQVITNSSVGHSLAFGAQYFDVDGHLYFGNNGNGYIYIANIDASNSSSAFFAYGPSSNSNDGARCAFASVGQNENSDFGDAPDSYGTLYDSFGARHGLSGLTLGSKIDGESEAYVFPLSDDTSGLSNDDDGIAFPVPLEIDELSFIFADVNGADGEGVLSAWIDWNQDGQFNDDEIILDSEWVDDGQNLLYFEVPSWALEGETWARFRLSHTYDVGPKGGVSAGEVEDYQVTVTDQGVSVEIYPIGSGYTTFAYEDQYPRMGDYDMNDVLMNIKYSEFSHDNKVIQLKIEGQIAALGGSYHSGFAIRLPGISPDKIKSGSVKLLIDDVLQDTEVVESGTIDAVFIIHEDLWSFTESGEDDGCNMFRTESGCGTQHRPSWSLIIPFENPVPTSQMPDLPYDPFIFATPGYYHGEDGFQVSGGHPGRNAEIHLKNKRPTGKFDYKYIGLSSDATSVTNSTYFHTSNGLPWAIEIPLDWEHPIENVSILDAYPQFADFSQDATGQTAKDWYVTPNAGKTFID